MEPENITRRYFTPGEVALIFDYGAKLKPNQVRKAVQNFLEQRSDLNLEFDGTRILQFQSDHPFALAFATVRGFDPRGKTEDDLAPYDADLLGTIDTLNKEATEQAYHVEYKSEEIAELTLFAKGKIKPLSSRDIRLSAASPNWVVGSAQGRWITGGPGAVPVEVPAPSVGGNSFHFSNPPKLHHKVNGKKGMDVEVVILDTAPSEDLLNRARERWPYHPILEALGLTDAPHNNKLRITRSDDLLRSVRETGQPDWIDECMDQNDYAHERHLYQMPDHGLFAAGNIRTIVPDARLHLIQVLNDYGVGTLESIAAGLHLIAAQREMEHSATPLVINMSLVFGMPIDDAHKLANARVDFSVRNTDVLIHALERICVDLDLRNASLVAAAGNDRAPHAARQPFARFPARFDCVIGVGSLNRDGSAAAYSNESDSPTVPDGILAFGGDAVPLAGHEVYLADAERGIMGVFISDFPDPRQQVTGNPVNNTTGWARWAGTSFAAPVVSGKLALLYSQSADPEDRTVAKRVREHMPEVAQG